MTEPTSESQEPRLGDEVIAADTAEQDRITAALVDEWAVQVTGPTGSHNNPGPVASRIAPASIGEEHVARGWLEWRAGNYRTTLKRNADSGSKQAQAAIDRLDAETYEIVTRQVTPWTGVEPPRPIEEIPSVPGAHRFADTGEPVELPQPDSFVRMARAEADVDG